MIIFYDKQSGRIIGTIDGRIHKEEHMNMWIGDKNETERIVVNWKPIKYFDKNGKAVGKDELDKDGNKKAFTADFEPDTDQKELFMQVDKKHSVLREYKIDVKSKKLIKKE